MANLLDATSRFAAIGLHSAMAEDALCDLPGVHAWVAAHGGVRVEGERVCALTRAGALAASGFAMHRARAGLRGSLRA